MLSEVKSELLFGRRDELPVIVVDRLDRDSVDPAGEGRAMLVVGDDT
jgi:hypothetical protein